MTLTVTEIDQLITLGPDGPLDEECVRSLVPVVEQALEKGKTHFLVHLQQVPYIDSAGLEGLIRLARKIGDVRGRLALVAPNKITGEILEATRLDKRFAVFNSTEQALQQMRAEI